MISKVPLVSVVMPVYNAERFLRRAIDSILDQTFKDFEFILVNDGSTDNSVKIIKTYQDPKIRFINKPKNSGYVDALNLGLKEAKGRYIARMDADDVSLPQRLEKEVNFLNAHPEIGLVGTTMQFLYENDRLGDVDPVLTGDEDIRKAFLVVNCLVHGSVMFRRELLAKAGYYNKQVKHVEDYDLWLRFAKKTKLANLVDPLYQWRINLSGLSHQNSPVQGKNAEELRKAHWENEKKAGKLPKPSITYDLGRARFYLSRQTDPYRRQRVGALADVCVWYAKRLANDGDIQGAIKELVSAVIMRPRHLKTYLDLFSLLAKARP